MYQVFFENSDEILPIEFIKKSAHNTKTWKQSNMLSLSIFIISYSAIILVFSRNKASQSQTFSKIFFLSSLEIVEERRRSEKRKKTKKSSQSQREKRFHLLLFLVCTYKI